MGTLGARTIREMQEVDVVVAPSLLTEGKVYQRLNNLVWVSEGALICSCVRANAFTLLTHPGPTRSGFHS